MSSVRLLVVHRPYASFQFCWAKYIDTATRCESVGVGDLLLKRTTLTHCQQAGGTHLYGTFRLHDSSNKEALSIARHVQLSGNRIATERLLGPIQLGLYRRRSRDLRPALAWVDPLVVQVVPHVMDWGAYAFLTRFPALSKSGSAVIQQPSVV